MGLAADCGYKSLFFRQWAAAYCAALPTAIASQYASLHCKPLLLWFPCKLRYVNVRTFNLSTFMWITDAPGKACN